MKEKEDSSDLQLVRRLCRCCKTTLCLEEKKLYVFNPSSSSNSAKSEVCLWMKSQSGEYCTLHYKNNVDDRYYDVNTYGSSLEDACKNFLDTALDPRYSLKTDSLTSSFSKKSGCADFPDESVDTREKLSIWLALRGF